MKYPRAAVSGGLMAALSLLMPGAAIAQEPIQGGNVLESDVGATSRSCLAMYQIDRIQVVDDQTLLFHMKGNSPDYINRLPYRCNGLEDNVLVHETPMNAYCDKDVISVVDIRIGMRMGSCPLGEFEAYSAPEGE